MQKPLPVRPSESCIFSREKPNKAMRYSNGRTGLGNRGSQEDEGHTAVQ